MDEIVLIDKPKGISSFDVIRTLRKKTGIRKMGHAGTLDPNATGLLIVGIGDGTKKLKDLIGLPKKYEAEILLGVRTDSGDIVGNVVEKRVVRTFLFEDIKNEVKNMVGEHLLSAPIYSAIKKGGVPLYKYARKGLHVEIPLKKMIVLSVELFDVSDNVIKVMFEVSSGSYIRTLAEELARRLGTVGTLKNLRRISIGEYKIENARTLEDF